MEYILYPQKAGELELKKYLRACGNKVDDVSNTPAYWSKDIDLIVNGKTAIEVKWDTVMHSTGNLFIETCSNIDSNKLGWYYFCEADKLYYGDAATKEFYVFNYNELKKHIE